MKFVTGFLFGTIVGVAVALLYAPSTGKELRTNIKTQADTQYAKLQKKDKLSGDLQAMADQVKPSETPETAQPAA